MVIKKSLIQIDEEKNDNDDDCETSNKTEIDEEETDNNDDATNAELIAADQALREDLRIAAKCGGRNYSDAIKENLLKYVARLDDAELTRAQPGWAALWGQSTRIKNIRKRSASIVDRALVLLGVDSRIVKSLIDILNSLSSETKLKEGIIVRILDVRFLFFVYSIVK